MAYQGIDYERSYNVFYVIGTMVIIGLWVFLKPIPKPAPDKSFSFGCYSAVGAPPIRLDRKGMQVLQDGLLPIGFHLDRDKAGIVLLPQKPILAVAYDGGENYSIEYSGHFFIRFYTVANGRRYGAFDERKLDGFTIITSKYKELPYQKGPVAKCLSIQPEKDDA